MYIVIMRGSTKILDIMTPRVGLVALGCGHVGDILNMLNFNENLLQFSWAKGRLTTW